MRLTPTRRSRLIDVAWGVGVLLGAVFVGVAIASFLDLRHDFEEATEEREVADQERDLLASDAAILADQLETLGVKPVIDIEAPRGPQGDVGPRGPMGPPPSQRQISTAVAEYLFTHPPAPGRAPTAAEIAAAVADYCAATDCDGADGAPGTPGPGPTDEQVAASVAAYCDARGGCPGPAGPQGEPGTDGADGEPPESFTFDVGPRTYSCTDPDRDGAYDCTAETKPPTEENP